MPEWCFKDFNLNGQSNYAFNVILKEANKELMHNLENKLESNGIEYRRGSAGGGNQMRQPYVKSIFNFTEEDFKIISPVTDHIHFYGMYLGNYPELTFDSIREIASIISSV